MTSYVPPIKNGASGWIGYVRLSPRTPTGQFQTNPTLATGDVKVSIDGGSLANITTLPAVTPAGGDHVKVTLSQAEINGDNICVQFKDAAGAEWCDLAFTLQTAAYSVDTLPNANADALLDRTDAIEAGVTVRGYMRVTGAMLAGVVSGAGTGTETFRNMVANSKDRVVITDDAAGNRSALTITQT